jgi:hypothetical protein
MAGSPLGGGGVAVGEAGQGGRDDPPDVGAHLVQRDDGLGRWWPVGEPWDRLGHVGAQAAHALQMRVDVQQARDQPQVPGDRRLPRQGAQQSPFDLGRCLADLPVPPDDPLRGIGVGDAVGQRNQGVVELRLHRPAEGDQAAVKVGQLLVEGCPHAGTFHPNARIHQLPALLLNAWRPDREASGGYPTGGGQNSAQAAEANRSGPGRFRR